MNKFYTFIYFIFIVVFFASCTKKMDDAWIPSYVNIENIQILTNSNQGSSSSNITDAWLYIDGADRGAYPLPTRIPYLGEGTHTIKVAPGIMLNGVSSTRVPYPLVEPHEVDVELFKDSVVNLDVKCRYYNTTSFAMIEDFEDINIGFEATPTSTAVWRSTSSSSDPESYIFEGSHSGGGFLDEEKNSLQIVTRQFFTELPKSGTPVFIELNFNTNTTIVVSVTGYVGGIGNSNDLIYLNPTDGIWKKIYINLTSTLSYDVSVDEYRFVLSANHSNGSEPSVVLIDNFKILYRDLDK
jgi:hypothetical protein